MHYFVLDENRIFLLCDKVSVVPRYIANVLQSVLLILRDNITNRDTYVRTCTLCVCSTIMILQSMFVFAEIATCGSFSLCYNGTCNANNTCVCSDGYTGYECSQRACKLYLHMYVHIVTYVDVCDCVIV